MNKQRLGILYMIIASSAFAFMSLMVKLSGGRIPLFEQVFFRNLIMVAFASVMLKKDAITINVPREYRATLSLRCLFGYLGVVSVFYANNHLTLADAQILQKLNPFFVILASVILLGERMTFPRFLTVIAGFTGAAIIIDPTGSFNLFPSLVGLGSALFSGLAYVSIRKLSGKIHGMVIIYWFSLLSVLFTIPIMLTNLVLPNSREWLFLIMIGVFSALGQYFITRAYITTEASKVTLYDYTGVLISPILGYLVFGELLKPNTLAGTCIIIVSGYVAAKLKDPARR